MLNCLYWNVKQMVNKFFWKTALSLQYHPTYISGHHLFSVWRDSIHHITNLTCALFVLKTWLYGFVMLRTAAFGKVHSSRRCFRNFFQFIVLTLYLRSITIHIYMTLCMFVHDRCLTCLETKITSIMKILVVTQVKVEDSFAHSARREITTLLRLL